MAMSTRQLDRDIRRSLTSSLRRWNAYSANPMQRRSTKSVWRRYERKLPEGKYAIEPSRPRPSAEDRHLVYRLTFTPVETANQRPWPLGGYRVHDLGVYSSPEEAANAAATHYAELN